MKNKIKYSLLVLIAGTMAFTLFNQDNTKVNVKAALAENDDTPNFDEDFEGYTVDGDLSDLSANWTNAWFEHSGDFNENACNNERFMVKADPTDPTNKVLYVDTQSNDDSFSYITIKDLFVKNFELSYRYYSAYDGTGAPWFGITCRKPVDGRYNGVTNVQLLTRFWTNDSVALDAYRSVDDSFTIISEKYGPSGEEGTTPISYNGADHPEAGVFNTWINVKFRVVDGDFSLYVNDVLLGKAVCNKKSASNYGYVSFVSCVNRGYLDDIHLENLDEVPYQQEGTGGEVTIPAPTMTNTSYDYTGQDLSVDVALGGEAITEIKRGNTALLSKYYTVEGDKVTISKDYLDTLSEGIKSFVLTTAGGSVSFTISIPGAEEPAPSEEPTSQEQESAPASEQSSSATEPSESVSQPDNTPTEKKGCKGAASTGVVISLLSLLGIGFTKRRRK